MITLHQRHVAAHSAKTGALGPGQLGPAYALSAAVFDAALSLTLPKTPVEQVAAVAQPSVDILADDGEKEGNLDLPIRREILFARDQSITAQQPIPPVILTSLLSDPSQPIEVPTATQLHDTPHRAKAAPEVEQQPRHPETENCEGGSPAQTVTTFLQEPVAVGLVATVCTSSSTEGQIVLPLAHDLTEQAMALSAAKPTRSAPARPVGPVDSSIVARPPPTTAIRQTADEKAHIPADPVASKLSAPNNTLIIPLDLKTAEPTLQGLSRAKPDRPVPVIEPEGTPSDAVAIVAQGRVSIPAINQSLPEVAPHIFAFLAAAHEDTTSSHDTPNVEQILNLAVRQMPEAGTASSEQQPMIPDLTVSPDPMVVPNIAFPIAIEPKPQAPVETRGQAVFVSAMTVEMSLAAPSEPEYATGGSAQVEWQPSSVRPTLKALPADATAESKMAGVDVDHRSASVASPLFPISVPPQPLRSVIKPTPPQFPKAIAEIAAKVAVHVGHEPSVELVLNPVELGRVRFAFAAVGDQLQVTLHAERPETIALLRRHVDDLRTEFRAAGVNAATLSFGHWSHDKSGDHTQRQFDMPDLAPSSPVAPVPPVPAPKFSAPGLNLRL